MMRSRLDLSLAERLVAPALACIERPFPYKSHHVLSDAQDLVLPRVHHPAFYGCFDWHSAVHAHWTLAVLRARFPQLREAARIDACLDAHLSAENLATEGAYFDLHEENASFERMYGWTWLLELARELHRHDDDASRRRAANLRPLAARICELYVDYLPRLTHPLRVGEHDNTAFGLGFALDYARAVGHSTLAELIESRAIDFYADDVDAPLHWEPSGHDFLSPCLQELDLMRRVLDAPRFERWAERFLPGLFTHGVALAPARPSDRHDGKLVHLDGLNFARAWCLAPLADRSPTLGDLADAHLEAGLEALTSPHYSGAHWLGSFALHALRVREGG